ncbi:hypothetical protein HDU93_003434 [Gonapodya sp. JEL0774]|nr:hypothetical protein HDU93_003434 [Gonapodya sp. JEL0774]
MILRFALLSALVAIPCSSQTLTVTWNVANANTVCLEVGTVANRTITELLIDWREYTSLLDAAGTSFAVKTPAIAAGTDSVSHVFSADLPVVKASACCAAGSGSGPATCVGGSAGGIPVNPATFRLSETTTPKPSSTTTPVIVPTTTTVPVITTTRRVTTTLPVFATIPAPPPTISTNPVTSTVTSPPTTSTTTDKLSSTMDGTPPGGIVKAVTTSTQNALQTGAPPPPASGEDGNARIIIIAISAIGGLVVGGILLVGGAWFFGGMRQRRGYPEIDERDSPLPHFYTSQATYPAAPHSPGASISGKSASVDANSPRSPVSPTATGMPPSLPFVPASPTKSDSSNPMVQVGSRQLMAAVPQVSPQHMILAGTIAPAPTTVEHIYWLFLKFAQPLNRVSEVSVPYSGPNPLIALRRHTPSMNDEIELIPGNAVAVRDVYRDGWAVGTNLNTMADGCFPMDSLRLSDLFLSESGRDGVQIHSSESDVASVRRESRAHVVDTDGSATSSSGRIAPLSMVSALGDVRGPPQSFFAPSFAPSVDSTATEISPESGQPEKIEPDARVVRGPRPWTGVKSGE